MATATFAAGCFWGIEETFRNTKGVLSTVVGYMGGTTANPSYKEVCTDKTGHAEVVQVNYDPTIIEYDALLDIFWKLHDPTQLNRQGPDVGTQYRSAIYFHTEQQRQQAIVSKEMHQKKLKKKIVTQIAPAATFFKAEEYHQQYLAKRGLGTCHI